MPAIEPPTVAHGTNDTSSAQTKAPSSLLVTNAVTAAKHTPSQQPVAAVPVQVSVDARATSFRKVENDPKVPKNRQVLLSHRRIVVESGRKFPAKFCATQSMTARKTAPYVLLSEKPVDRSVRCQAMANGAKVSGFLPNNALLVEANAESLKNLADDPMFIAAVEYEPMDKLQPQLLANTNETFRATVVLMNRQYFDAMRDFVTAHGGSVPEGLTAQGKSFDAILTKKLAAELASKAEVRWIKQGTR